MLLTGNYGLRKPELGEPVDVRDFNYNADVIDSELKNRPTASGNASEMTVEFEKATQLTEIKSGSSLKTLFGKLALVIKIILTNEENIKTLQIIVNENKLLFDAALEDHKNGSDHDGRYYTKDEINVINNTYALFTIESGGDASNNNAYIVDAYRKKFGSSNIHFDQYGAVICDTEGVYQFDIKVDLDRDFTSDIAELQIRRYNNDTGADDMITETYFYSENCYHTASASLMVPMKAGEYLKVYVVGRVAGGTLSMFRVN